MMWDNGKYVVTHRAKDQVTRNIAGYNTETEQAALESAREYLAGIELGTCPCRSAK